jgi:hypothetical protein
VPTEQDVQSQPVREDGQGIYLLGDLDLEPDLPAVLSCLQQMVSRSTSPV